MKRANLMRLRVIFNEIDLLLQINQNWTYEIVIEFTHFVQEFVYVTI